MASITEIGMSLDEFLERYDETPFELVDGACIPLRLMFPGPAA